MFFFCVFKNLVFQQQPANQFVAPVAVAGASAGAGAGAVEAPIRRDDDPQTARVDDADNGDGAIDGDVDNNNNADDSANRPHPPSSPWRHFFFDNGDGSAKCLLPPSKIGNQGHALTISTKGGASNLLRHLQGECHKTELNKFNELLGPPTFMSADAAADKIIEEQNAKHSNGGAIGKAFRTAKRLSGAVDENLTDALIRELSFVCFIIKKGLSFNCADDAHLAHFVGLASQAALPKRQRVSDVLLPLMYEIICAARDELVKSIEYFSITVDGWTSVAKDQYLSLTVHTITPEWQREAFLLDLIPLPISHTWLNMAHAVALRLMQMMPANATLVATVTDNG